MATNPHVGQGIEGPRWVGIRRSLSLTVLAIAYLTNLTRQVDFHRVRFSANGVEQDNDRAGYAKRCPNVTLFAEV